jgi:hypothetical protein
MGSGVAFFIRTLIAEEMRDRVASAKKRGETLSIPAQIDEIASSYPGSALTDDDLRNRLFAEATRAGVDVDLTWVSSKPH